MRNEDAAAVLRKVASFLLTLSDEDATDLIEGRQKLELAPRDRATKRRASASELSEREIEQILDELRSSTSRDEGDAVLARADLKKKDLEAIARFADLPVRRRDKVSDLEDRLVESTIGYRLRSRAIKGKDGGAK